MKALKIRFTIVFLFGVFGLHNLLLAQKVVLPDRIPGTPADTLYYFFDKAHATDSVRMSIVREEADSKIFKVNCLCLNLDNKSIWDKNIYLQGLKKKTLMNTRQFASLKLVTLKGLIDFVRSHNNPYMALNSFGGRNVVFIIESANNRFVVHKVYNSSGLNVTVE
jgi:hypothetical protein